MLVLPAPVFELLTGKLPEKNIERGGDEEARAPSGASALEVGLVRSLQAAAIAAASPAIHQCRETTEFSIRLLQVCFQIFDKPVLLLYVTLILRHV
jgi:hypothetical protein